MIYNTFRPKTFLEMKGQTINRKILTNQLISQELSQSYLFFGLHGSGKTTSAKIFAKGLNCLNLENGNPCNKCSSCKEFDNGINPDIIEVDAATNNKVEDVSKIKETLKYSPIYKHKVIIMDEAHMLSKAAWNSLLTTLEEESNNVFIFCSTEINKFPQTILSRCLKLQFANISEKDILENLKFVSTNLSLRYDIEGLEMISNSSNGSIRDSLSLLEKCISYGELTKENISKILGFVNSDIIFSFVYSMLKNDYETTLNIIDELFVEGEDLLSFTERTIIVLKDIYVWNKTKNKKLIKSDLEKISPIKVNQTSIFSNLNIFYEMLSKMKDLEIQKILLETTVLNILFEDVVIEGNTFSKDNTPNDNSKTIPSKDNQINHIEYLINSIDLLKAYDVNDPDLITLLNANIYCNKKYFIIKSSNNIDIDKVKSILKDVTGKDLNVILKN